MLAGLGTDAAYGQTSPLIIDQQRTDRAAPGTKPAAEAPVPQAGKVELAKKVTPFVLRAVQISGTSIPIESLTAAAQPFIGKEVGAAEIKAIEAAMSDAYAHSDIALYTIVVPDQDFANGALKIDVIEGYVENVDLEGDTSGDLGLIKAYAARLTAERPVSRATFQRYVSLIRDIAGLKADIQLYEGSARGAVRMAITLHQKILDLNLALNNGGSEVLGRTQFEADATAYGLLREGEQTVLTFAVPTTPARFQYVAFSDAEPIGDEGTMGRFSAGYLHTRPRFSSIDGHAEVAQILVSHPLIRSYDENLVLSGSLDGINSEDAVLGAVLSNEQVRTLRGAAAYSHTYTTDSFVVSATLSQGLDILDARVSSPLLASLDFTKLTAQGAFTQVLWKDWVVRLRATAQYGFDRLPSSEFFTLGGPDFGRAFAAATLTGDQAVAGSFEFAWHPEKFPISAINGSEVYAFVDAGETWLLKRGALVQPGLDLVSAGGGVRIPFGENSDVQLEVARQVDAPAAVVPHPGWTFNFALRQRI